jgi:hypothetical protein
VFTTLIPEVGLASPFPPWAPTDLASRFGVNFERHVQSAFARTVFATLDQFNHLPVPVALRAAGALTAWEKVFCILKPFGPARAALADKSLSTTMATREFMAALTQYISFKSKGMERVGLIQNVCDLSADLWAFGCAKARCLNPRCRWGIC